MNVALVLFKADGTRCDFPLKKSKTVIGRTLRCDLRIPLSEVSRRHCEIRITPKDVILRDLGSCNGTYHNSNAIKNAKLQPGDEVVIGPVIFTVLIDDEPTHIYPRRTLVRQINEMRDGGPHKQPRSVEGSSSFPAIGSGVDEPSDTSSFSERPAAHGRGNGSGTVSDHFLRDPEADEADAKGGVRGQD